MLAVVGNAVVGFPQSANELEALLENSLVVVERHMERLVFAPVVAAPGSEIDPAVGQQIERRPLLGDANGMMQRRHRYRGREPDARRVCGDVGEHKVRAGQHAERIEVVLADPGRMHAELVGVERLGGDVGDELVRGSTVVFVVVVAQREITELHVLPPTRPYFHCHGAQNS